METLHINDFSAGWVPSDDAVNGRKNGLLKMESVELDKNGCLSMSYGTSRIGTSAFSNSLHSVYHKFLASGQFWYSADTAGNLFRTTLAGGNTNIGSGGSTSRAAFLAAWNYVLAFSGNLRKRDDGTNTANLGQVKPSAAPTVISAGAGNLRGTYEYVQINVFLNGAYIARSGRGPISTSLVLNNENATVTAQAPTSPANEVWIFRRGGTLDQFYRVKRLTSAYTTPFTDSMIDDEAYDEGITLSLTALSVNSTDLPDAILGAAGPINGRMILCTATHIHITEANSPETYIPGQSFPISASGTGSEIFQWVIQVGDNTVLIGTSENIYNLEGTFYTLPDGKLDIFLHPFGVADPPISIDVTKFNTNGIIYMSKSGYRAMSSSGEDLGLIGFQNVSRLYRGETCYDYGGIPIYITPAYRYSVAVSNNKMFVRVPTIVDEDAGNPFDYRMDIYDFTRQSWRTLPPATYEPPLFLATQEDGAVFGFFDDEKRLKLIDNPFRKTLHNNTSTKQTVTILTPFHDNGKPRNRKTPYTLKFKVNTGGDNCAAAIFLNDDLDTPILLGNINTSVLTEKFIDISEAGEDIGIFKNIAFRFIGTMADFQLNDISVEYELHPPQVTFVSGFIPQTSNKFNKRRARSWPIVIDTLASPVTFTPIVDGVAKTALSISNSGKKTHLYYFTEDVFGIDYDYTLAGDSLFELWEIGDLDVVQTLPPARRMDQIGPIEIFKYAWIKAIELRIIGFGGTSIPYTVYFDDVSKITGTLTIEDGKENFYTINLTKTVAGSILRIVLGPTASAAFTFHRISTKIQAARSGHETELEWIQV